MAFRGIQSTNIISTEVGFTDPILILNKDGSTAVDVGFLGKIGSTSYAGLVKDSTTEDFLLIKSISINSSSINDIDATDLSLVKGDLVVDTVTGDLIGDVTGQVSDISNFNTNSLSEGVNNLYYTHARDSAQFDIDLATKNTDNLSEGSTNLYFTNARADARAQLKFDELVGAAPSALNTLDELAAALGDDANFSTTVTNSIAAKLPLAGGVMTGDLIMDGNEIHLADNGEIRLGNAADLVIYHDGSDSVIKDKGTGNLSVRTNGNFYLMNEAGTETIIRADVNGSVDLYYDNSKKIETTSAGVDISGGLVCSPNTAGKDTFELSTNAVDEGRLRIKNVDTTTVQIRAGGDSYFNGGNVGIGITSPGAKLSVSGPASLANLGGGSTGSAALYVNSTSGHTGELIQVLRNSTTKMHMANDGKLGLGTSSPTEVLHVVGSILATGDITAYSDDSLKTNVQVIDNAVGKVEQLRGVTFDRIEDGSTSTGVIAQELKEVLPEAVHTDEQGVHSVAYGNVVGLLIEAIKEQQKQIDELIKANKS